MKTSPWNEELENRLRELVTNTYSASQIAAELGNGISRNGVIGKMHRLGLRSQHASRTRDAARSDNGIKMRILRRKQHAQKIKATPLAAPKPMPKVKPKATAAHPPKLLTIPDLTAGMCRWVEETGPLATFCANDVEPGTSWCPHHLARVYVEPPARVRIRRLGLEAA